MSTRLFPARETALWAGAFLVVAALLITSGFSSDDPDSALYAGIAGRLAEEPVARWIAPEWFTAHNPPVLDQGGEGAPMRQGGETGEGHGLSDCSRAIRLP